MAGANDHLKTLWEYHPGSRQISCNGDGIWATITGPDGTEVQAKCTGCAHDRLMESVREFVPPRFRAPVQLPAAVADWAATGANAQGLYLAGPVGTGKTHTAWHAAVAWCSTAGVNPKPRTVEGWGDFGPPVIFTRMTDLLDDLRPGDGAVRRVRHCQNAGLLIVDDIGAEKPSEWTQERIYSVIDHRYANCLPLIVTSNLPPAKLGGQVGARTESRLAEMCTVIPMTGTDRRKPAA